MVKLKGLTLNSVNKRIANYVSTENKYTLSRLKDLKLRLEVLQAYDDLHNRRIAEKVRLSRIELK